MDGMPADTWDSHMHVTDPAYPLAATAAYKPSLHSIDHAMHFEHGVGIPNIVLVQPSIYGTDNSLLLDALKSLGPRHGRGVVEIDPDNIQQSQLREWHALGVRGLRINLMSNKSQFTKEELKDKLTRYARVARPLGWVVQLFISMAALPLLEGIVEGLDVKFCIDHFGSPKLPGPTETSYPLDPYTLPGFESMIKLLQGGRTWVKISGAYRIDPDPEMRGAQSLAQELLKVAPDKLVFATDWPHTRFDGFDVKPFIQKCIEWSEGQGLTEQLFSSNARTLWDVER